MIVYHRVFVCFHFVKVLQSIQKLVNKQLHLKYDISVLIKKKISKTPELVIFCEEFSLFITLSSNSINHCCILSLGFHSN